MAASNRPSSPCGDLPPEPRRPRNRAGLAQIAYRITTQPEALARMRWELPRRVIPHPETGAPLTPLNALSTRQLEDPTISLMDTYALACDVLAFYSERVANEGFLGTATQRRSVLELTRMIGYRMAPGVASSTHLAFTVEASDDPYRVVQIEPGVQAMSIPHQQGKLPQVFETLEAITARAEWNDIRARTLRPQHLAIYHDGSNEDNSDNGRLYLIDLDNSFDIQPGNDSLLRRITNDNLKDFHPLNPQLDLQAAMESRTNQVLHALPVDEVYLQGLSLNLSPGTRILAVGNATRKGGSVTTVPFRVVSAQEDQAFGLTKVVLTASGSAPDVVRSAPRFRAPLLLRGDMPTRLQPLDVRTVNSHIRGRYWSGDELAAVVRSQTWERRTLMNLVQAIMGPAPEQQERGQVAVGLHVMRQSAGFFGATAPHHDTLNYGWTGSVRTTAPYRFNWDKGLNNAANTIWRNGLGDLNTSKEDQALVYLDREIKELQPNSWVIIEDGEGGAACFQVSQAATQSRADYSITGKTTAVTLTVTNNGSKVNSKTIDGSHGSFCFRTSQIHAVSEQLPLAGVPLERELPKGSSSLDLDRLYLDLEKGRPVSLSGIRSDARGIMEREIHVIKGVHHIDGITRLLLAEETTHSYDRTTVRINANVALATHGETVSEDLGSGDARETFQTFTLAKAPLTHVSAANETGCASTLRIRVNGQLWRNIPALGQAGPDDAVYEILQADSGTTQVRFGDGLTGRRLPTGERNITATYRTGIGFDGEVPEEAISQLRSRPLGIRSAINPSAATGAADRETLQRARLIAPGKIKTMGRIISLKDYEDFAQDFAGVGKALVGQLWSGQRKVIHLTIAPEANSSFTDSDPLLARLSESIGNNRDLHGELVIQPYRRRYFSMTARITVDPTYLSEDVIRWSRKTLESGFGYEERQLAQAVSAAEVISTLQATRGVKSVDLDTLAILNDGATPTSVITTPQSLLPAAPALGPGQRGQGDVFSPAELLLVLPSAITLIPMKASDA
jgi:predicted phage baseplate assembly protein